VVSNDCVSSIVNTNYFFKILISIFFCLLGLVSILFLCSFLKAGIKNLPVKQTVNLAKRLLHNSSPAAYEDTVLSQYLLLISLGF